jgi:3-hydroxyanthranilate 3,4-dioxygenase
LKSGDLFLMPGRVPHSPRRGEGSWTLVVERKRTKEEMDRFVWPCEKCGEKLYETEVRFDEPSDAVANATNRMRSDPALATCAKCGQVLGL